MITYSDGTEAKIGDVVLYHDEQSIVDTVIDSADEIADWGLSEQGVMLRNATFGLVFEPLAFFDQETLVFVSRRETVD
ncbi:hypothetical protein BH11PLA2_BH11PLA2_33440 [soil metagenome]